MPIGAKAGSVWQQLARVSAHAGRLLPSAGAPPLLQSSYLRKRLVNQNPHEPLLRKSAHASVSLPRDRKAFPRLTRMAPVIEWMATNAAHKAEGKEPNHLPRQVPGSASRVYTQNEIVGSKAVGPPAFPQLRRKMERGFARKSILRVHMGRVFRRNGPSWPHCCQKVHPACTHGAGFLAARSPRGTLADRRDFDIQGMGFPPEGSPRAIPRRLSSSSTISGRINTSGWSVPPSPDV